MARACDAAASRYLTPSIRVLYLHTNRNLQYCSHHRLCRIPGSPGKPSLVCSVGTRRRLVQSFHTNPPFSSDMVLFRLRSRGRVCCSLAFCTLEGVGRSHSAPSTPLP